ncbi:ATP synthase subunit B family protein [Halarcobacter anaerophilus]|nr:hypothetical protein [Halarcobacter anaerophilus]
MKLIDDLIINKDNNIDFVNEGQDISIDIKIEKSDYISLLQDFDENSILKEIKINNTNCNLTSIEINKTYSLQLSISYLRKVYKYFIFKDFDEFLNVNRVNNISEFYYIHEFKYSSLSTEKKLDFIMQYEKISQLFNIINQISIDKDKEGLSDYKYTIFDKRKIFIHSLYNKKDILIFQNIKNIDELINTFTDEILVNAEKRINKIFLINALEDTLSKDKKQININEIFPLLSKVYDEYQIHHRAYINSLDPAKLKEDANKALKEYFSKLNTLLSDVNSKIIFLPIAFIVSLGQMSSQTQAKNFIILLGMSIFCLILYKFSVIQRDILNALSKEIESKKEECKEVNKLYNSVESTLASLEKLTFSIKDRFNWTIKLNTMIFVIVFLSFLFYSNIQWDDYIKINGKPISSLFSKMDTKKKFNSESFSTLQNINSKY